MWKHDFQYNIIGEELLLNFGVKFQNLFVISHVKLQNCHGNRSVSLCVKMATKFKNAMNEDVRAQKDTLENLNTQENIKKDSNRYFAEKVWKILNFISQI